MIETNILNNEQLEFMNAVDKEVRIGNEIVGKIISINEEGIFVSLVGYKTDGVIPMKEITIKENTIEVLTKLNVGDEITAKVIKLKNIDNLVVLSRMEYEKEEAIEVLKKYYNDNVKFKIKIAEVKENGLVGYYSGIRIFIPASQIDIQFITDRTKFLNTELEIILIEFKLGRPNRIVGSRRLIKEIELKKLEENSWRILEVGQIVSGEVKRFTNFGAFININGIDGLVHVSQISWLHVKHPKDYLNIGDIIDVKIIGMNKEQGRLSLSIKELSPQPWTLAQDKYIEDSIVLGKVVKINDFGAFIELEPGIDGLVHISKISHNKINSPSDILNVGDEVKVRILSVDSKNKRISLSIKDV